MPPGIASAVSRTEVIAKLFLLEIFCSSVEDLQSGLFRLMNVFCCLPSRDDSVLLYLIMNSIDMQELNKAA